jgi:hypothetical protein
MGGCGCRHSKSTSGHDSAEVKSEIVKNIEFQVENIPDDGLPKIVFLQADPTKAKIVEMSRIRDTHSIWNLYQRKLVNKYEFKAILRDFLQRSRKLTVAESFRVTSKYLQDSNFNS